MDKAYVELLDVGILRRFRGVSCLEVDLRMVYTKLGSDKCHRRILKAGIVALRERVVNTSTESLEYRPSHQPPYTNILCPGKQRSGTYLVGRLRVEGLDLQVAADVPRAVRRMLRADRPRRGQRRRRVHDGEKHGREELVEDHGG